MTGWLAVSGIVLVLLASAYTGLQDSGNATSAPTVEITPVSDLDNSGGAADVTVTPTATPVPPAPTATPGEVANRADCNQIRGTQYHSPEERTWYLANCVNH